MDLNLEDRHLELARIARQLFESRCSLERVRALEADETGYSPELWQEMAGLDWLGLQGVYSVLISTGFILVARLVTLKLDVRLPH